MSRLDELVDTLLWEGHQLYPYTPGAVKNATPTPFGIVYPSAYARGSGFTHDRMRMECLVDGGALSGTVRCLAGTVELPEPGEVAFDLGGVTGLARLELEPGKCEDPHVERLLEGFAFLTARVQSRIDSDLPEISEALLDVLHPQYVRPIPSMSLVQLHPDPDRVMAGGHRVKRVSLLYSREVGGAQCRFRTCHDTTLWPVAVTAARWMAPYELQPPVRASSAVAALSIAEAPAPITPMRFPRSAAKSTASAECAQSRFGSARTTSGTKGPPSPSRPPASTRRRACTGGPPSTWPSKPYTPP